MAINKPAVELQVPVTLFLALAIAAVWGRLYSRMAVTRNAGVDDWLCVFALTLSLVVYAVNAVAMARGFGGPMDEMDAQALATIGQLMWISPALWGLSTNAIKMSIVLSYTRIWASRRLLAWLHALVAVLAAFGLAMFFGAIFKCVPVAAAWDGSEGRCLPPGVFEFTTSTINLGFDILVYAIAVPMIRQLQVSPRLKKALMFVFTIGVVVCVASIMRLVYIMELAYATDKSVAGNNLGIWSGCENNLAIVSACLPTLRPLLSRVFPGFLGPTTGSSRGPTLASFKTRAGHHHHPPPPPSSTTPAGPKSSSNSASHPYRTLQEKKSYTSSSSSPSVQEKEGGGGGNLYGSIREDNPFRGEEEEEEDTPPTSEQKADSPEDKKRYTLAPLPLFNLETMTSHCSVSEEQFDEMFRTCVYTPDAHGDSAVSLARLEGGGGGGGGSRRSSSSRRRASKRNSSRNSGVEVSASATTTQSAAAAAAAVPADCVFKGPASPYSPTAFRTKFPMRPVDEESLIESVMVARGEEEEDGGGGDDDDDDDDDDDTDDPARHLAYPPPLVTANARVSAVSPPRITTTTAAAAADSSSRTPAPASSGPAPTAASASPSQPPPSAASTSWSPHTQSSSFYAPSPQTPATPSSATRLHVAQFISSSIAHPSPCFSSPAAAAAADRRPSTPDSAEWLPVPRKGSATTTTTTTAVVAVPSPLSPLRADPAGLYSSRKASSASASSPLLLAPSGAAAARRGSSALGIPSPLFSGSGGSRNNSLTALGISSSPLPPLLSDDSTSSSRISTQFASYPPQQPAQVYSPSVYSHATASPAGSTTAAAAAAAARRESMRSAANPDVSRRNSWRPTLRSPQWGEVVDPELGMMASSSPPTGGGSWSRAGSVVAPGSASFEVWA